MRKTPLLPPAARFAAIALPLALLAACNNKPTQIESGPDDPDAKTVAAAPKVKLPPMVMASRTYRCKDNSLIYVDFFNDNVTADLRMKKEGDPTKLTAPEAGKPYEGGGHKVEGNGPTITYDGKSCKA